ncbi:hypothetical protein C8R43DRAFT_953570 [Mycena crocata]|nr:hypothetical protein C8R43DRAFT_953570 [Mycena crocata]
MSEGACKEIWSLGDSVRLNGHSRVSSLSELPHAGCSTGAFAAHPLDNAEAFAEGTQGAESATWWEWQLVGHGGKTKEVTREPKLTKAFISLISGWGCQSESHPISGGVVSLVFHHHIQSPLPTMPHFQLSVSLQGCDGTALVERLDVGVELIPRYILSQSDIAPQCELGGTSAEFKAGFKSNSPTAKASLHVIVFRHNAATLVPEGLRISTHYFGDLGQGSLPSVFCDCRGRHVF